MILIAAVLSNYDVITASARIYTNLILHVIYLCGLTVVIMDHIPHTTSLQAKFIGITLSLVMLLLSVSALSTHSTRSLLERSQSLVPDQQEYVFTPQREGGYKIIRQAYQMTSQQSHAIPFEHHENLALRLPFSFSFDQQKRDSVFVNRNGIIAFTSPFYMQESDAFYMSQSYHHYSPTLSRQFVKKTPTIAPLFIRTLTTPSDSLHISQNEDYITFTWKYIQQDISGISSYVYTHPQFNSFFVTLYKDGRFILGHIDINAYLYDGALGYQYGSNSMDASKHTTFHTSGFSSLPAEASTEFIVDNFQQFRTDIHHEVTRMLWILLGAIMVIFGLFPLISKTSIFKPLENLIEGSRRIEAGDLETRVPVLTRDEIGEVTYHFNRMTESLQEAQQKLISHNENLEKEVSARTEEVVKQKHQIERQARELMEMDEIKSSFFANISHEFRTPLTLIMGPAQLALDGHYGELDSTLQRNHEMILSESKRLLTLINQLLDLSKFDAGMLTLNAYPVNLVELIDRIVRNFSSRASMEDKTIHFNSSIPHLVAPLDREKIENICYNLVDNAFKFTSSGGKILVSLEVTQKEDLPIAFLSVKDTGIGIPQEKLSKIFDRFHHAPKSTRGGTGIGLALVEKLVLLHSGTIEVESTPGFGTTFFVSLPIPKANERSLLHQQMPAPFLQETSFTLRSASPSRAETTSDAPDTASTVLIVDDDEKIQRFTPRISSKPVRHPRSAQWS